MFTDELSIWGSAFARVQRTGALLALRRYKELAMCKPGVLLVNYARGECLQKQVLAGLNCSSLGFQRTAASGDGFKHHDVQKRMSAGTFGRPGVWPHRWLVHGRALGRACGPQ